MVTSMVAVQSWCGEAHNTPLVPSSRIHDGRRAATRVAGSSSPIAASVAVSVQPLSPRFPTDPIVALSALEQAARIADGTLRSVDLVSRYLDRIATHDPTLNAFVTVLHDTALREAEAADKARARGAALGPFHGVPTAVKDHHLVRRTRTQIGSRTFGWLWSPVDDRMVKKLRGAGFVVVGKTTMSELGLLPIVETDLQPPTRNAWNPTRTAGGSSGGAAAAVGAGLLPIAPGSDGAGSVRIPASLNGLYGHKPSRGLVPDDSSKLDVYGLTVLGPLARSLDDAAALLDVMAAPGRGHHRAVSQTPPRRLRIGVVVDPPVGGVDPRIIARIHEAAEQLRAAGHHVESRPCPPGSVDDFIPIYQRFISRIPIVGRQQLQPVVRWFWEEGRRVTDADAMALFRAFEEMGTASMEGLDVMLSPTVGLPPFAVGEFAHLPPREMFLALAPLGAFTAIANLMGQPALSVPFGQVDGLPVGVQLMGRRNDDATLFALARQLQGAA